MVLDLYRSRNCRTALRCSRREIARLKAVIESKGQSRDAAASVFKF